MGDASLIEEEKYLHENVHNKHLQLVMDLEGEEPPLVVLEPVAESFAEVEGSHFEVLLVANLFSWIMTLMLANTLVSLRLPFLLTFQGHKIGWKLEPAQDWVN
ncbi:hypothetical protein MA16_Dca002167 [Dendrobium catenatum]|uniref:Uncharacterized protein n=1 Tax=Dendrobium catenatum TaxID=906689 RepID=A0A2I0XEJ5_9ASPA|nr:hypothetical protein MA16_Dca002167 [Dendrobium catenatum]